MGNYKGGFTILSKESGLPLISQTLRMHLLFSLTRVSGPLNILFIDD
jgi:hypothetical protein